MAVSILFICLIALVFFSRIIFISLNLVYIHKYLLRDLKIVFLFLVSKTSLVRIYMSKVASFVVALYFFSVSSCIFHLLHFFKFFTFIFGCSFIHFPLFFWYLFTITRLLLNTNIRWKVAASAMILLREEECFRLLIDGSVLAIARWKQNEIMARNQEQINVSFKSKIYRRADALFSSLR